MTTLTPTRLTQLPRVNLLPPEIAAAARLRSLKLILGLVVLGAMVVVVLGYLFASSRIGGAEEALADAKTDGTQLQADVATYSEVPQVLAEVDTARVNLETAMTPEIRWSFYLNDLSLTIPKTTRLGTITAVNSAAAGQLTPTGTEVGTPLGAVTLGSIAFSGKSTDFDAVAAWLQSLTKQQGYLEPSVQSVTRGEDAGTEGTFYEVESNTQLGLDAASGRYLQIANGE